MSGDTIHSVELESCYWIQMIDISPRDQSIIQKRRTPEKYQKSIARETLPDVHIHNVAVGPDPEMDKANTVFMRCVDQVQKLVH